MALNLFVQKGGPGSGHHGHKGIPGSRGGSAPSSGLGQRGSYGVSSVPDILDYYGKDRSLASKGIAAFTKGLEEHFEQSHVPIEIRSIEKDRIIRDLSEKTGIPYETVMSSLDNGQKHRMIQIIGHYQFRKKPLNILVRL